MPIRFYFVLFVAVISLFAKSAYGGDVIINYSPASLRFGSATSLHTSDLDDVLAASLGYTPQTFSWNGLTIVSAFQYPIAAVVFGVKDGGSPVKMEGTSYELKEDKSFEDTYYSLTSLIGNRAQRPVHYQSFNAVDLAKQFPHSLPVPKVETLDERKPVDALFLKQIAVLPSLADYLAEETSMNHGGQDVTFVEVDTFAPLVQQYGGDSAQVKEASTLLRSSIVQTIDKLRELYKDRVVVATAMVTNEKNLIRRVRDTVVMSTNVTNIDDLNLAAVYRDDFPIVFNIILILSIILTLAVVATSASMAFMDPGRDSIIYRMTNPRMKKEQ